MRKKRLMAIILICSLTLSFLPQSEVRAVNVVGETEAETEYQEEIEETAVINATDNIIPIIVTIVLFLFSFKFFIVNLLSKFIIISPQQFFHLQFLLSYQLL